MYLAIPLVSRFEPIYLILILLTGFCGYAEIFLIITMDPQKKKSLYQIRYILRLSCIKTLARKHKSTARTFLKRLGSEKLLEEFFTEEEETFSLIFPRTSFTLQRLYIGRIWYLDILVRNDFVNHF